MDSPSQTPEYAQALHYLYGRIDYERAQAPSPDSHFKLDRMRDLLAGLGNPQERLPVVHVAGTKGKGSTSAMIATVLQAEGYRVGLYTSPHIDRLEQRIMLDGVPCTPADIVQLTAHVQPLVAQLDACASERGWLSGPTFFEVTTAMALLYYLQQKVDVAVLEVGMGGRLDSTNVCKPLVCAITTISLDHTRQLGSTREEIAREKAGIIKPGVPVVTGVLEPGPLQVIREVSEHAGSPLYALHQDFTFASASFGNLPSPDDLEVAQPVEVRPGTMSYREPSQGTGYVIDQLSLGLLGRHQLANAAVAIASCNRLRELGWKISDDAIRLGLAQVRCPARFEIVARKPAVILDVAHNVASIEALLDALHEYFPRTRRRIIFAASKDKDCAGMLRRLLPHCAYLSLTKFHHNPRAFEPEALLELTDKLRGELPGTWPEILTFPEPVTAWEQARSACDPEELICITGSFYLAAELRSHVTAGSVPLCSP